MAGSESPRQTTFRTRLLSRLAEFRQRESQVFVVLAVLIGVFTGLVVVALIFVSERLGMRLFPIGGAPWRRVLFPIAGSLGVGYLLYKYFPNARGAGIPQTKAALFARDGYIPLRTVIGKFICTSATLGCGIPLGREGPSVQIGGGIASFLGRTFGLKPEQVRQLIPVGGAAAIAAAFNTPLAAVVFSLEEIMGDLHAPVMGAVVLAAATAWVVLHLFLGDQPLFHVPQYQLVHPAEFGIYAVLGVAGGALSAVFTRLLLAIRARFLRFPVKSVWFHPVAGGLLVAILGWSVPQVLGVGYSYVGDALNGHMALKMLALLVLLKLLTVTLCYGSGHAGGIFGPSLFMGAMLGGTVGTVVHHWFPAHTATAGAYALVGMGAVFAGIIRTPMTSVLMIFEMTQDYAVIVPLMIANLVSLFVARRLQHEPIYEGLAVQDGIHLPTTGTHRRRQHVARVMQRTAPSLAGDMTVHRALESVRDAAVRNWLVIDSRGIIGVLTRSRLEQLAAEHPDKTLAASVNPVVFPHVHPDQGLDLALERMGAHQIDILPVVNRTNVHQLEGVVTLETILGGYGVRQA